jgi:hypothetical protein
MNLKVQHFKIGSESPNKKHRHNSGHRVVFDDKWQQNRPWLQNTDNAMIN